SPRLDLFPHGANLKMAKHIMLQQIHVGIGSIGSYEASAGAECIAQLRTLAAPLRGARILHLNATPYGGGVAEILFSEIPLLRDLGLAAAGRIIRGDDDC